MQDDTNRESKECENDEIMLCPWECMYSPMHRKKLREEKELGQRCLGKEKRKEKKGGREKTFCVLGVRKSRVGEVGFAFVVSQEKIKFFFKKGRKVSGSGIRV